MLYEELSMLQTSGEGILGLKKMFSVLHDWWRVLELMKLLVKYGTGRLLIKVCKKNSVVDLKLCIYKIWLEHDSIYYLLT